MTIVRYGKKAPAHAANQIVAIPIIQPSHRINTEIDPSSSIERCNRLLPHWPFAKLAKELTVGLVSLFLAIKCVVIRLYYL